MSTPSAQRELARAERELARIGLLMRHDARLPSFTGAVVGAPFRGSWWAHPRTHEIYDLLQHFHRGAGALAVKLVDGKVTYVHRRLWPALLGVVAGAARGRNAGLAADAKRILATVRRRGAVRSDELAEIPARKRGAAMEALEAGLLVHAASVHTETGAHRKQLRSWARWCSDEGVRVEPLAPAAGRRELEDAVERLASGTGRRPRLPW
jgi:hypothetical protein